MGIGGFSEETACPECRAALRADQHYCLECGARRGEPRVDFLRELDLELPPAPVVAAPVVPESRVRTRLAAAGLATAVLAVGVAVGSTVGPAPAPATAEQAGLPVAALRAAISPPSPAAVVTTPASTPASAPTTSATDTTAAGTSAPVDTTTVDTTTPAVTTPATPAPTTTTPKPAQPTPTTPVPVKPPIGHVWVISLTGQDAGTVFGPATPAAAPYLGHDLAAQGTVLNDVLPVAQTSVAGGIALLSGQGPNAATTQGCPDYADVTPADVAAATGLARGTGCVYPAAVKTLPDQLATTGKTWRAYVEGTTGSPCRHPDLGQPDPWQQPRPDDPFLTVRDPFIAFHSIIDAPACQTSVVGLDQLTPDLATAANTPSFSWIVPDACHDGRDAPCADGAPAGLTAADAFLQTVVPQITATSAYRQDGLIAITFDAPAPGGDPVAAARPVGTLLLSPFVRRGRTVAAPSSPYALLRSIEDLFSLQHLGHADDPNVATFDDAIYTTTTP